MWARNVAAGMMAALTLANLAHADALADIKSRGTLVCGTQNASEPYAFPDAATRQIAQQLPEGRPLLPQAADQVPADVDPDRLVSQRAHRVLDDLAARLGHPPRFVTSTHGATSRYTDLTAMDHFLMAYCGQVNKRLVQQLLGRGVAALGLAAMDGGMVRGRRRADLRVREGGRTLVLHGDHAGSIERIDTTLLRSLIESGFTPVLCPPALGNDGSPINVDGDRLASELAIAITADLSDAGSLERALAHAERELGVVAALDLRMGPAVEQLRHDV